MQQFSRHNACNLQAIAVAWNIIATLLPFLQMHGCLCGREATKRAQRVYEVIDKCEYAEGEGYYLSRLSGLTVNFGCQY